MKYEDLLKEQVEELEATWDTIQEGNHICFDKDEFKCFGDFVKVFDFGDEDFFCTANRSDRWMDIVFPYHRETITLCDEELRALEQMIGRVIYDYDDLIDALHTLIDREVDIFRKEIA